MGGTVVAISQLFTRVDHLETEAMDHSLVECHGVVCERLEVHDTRLDGQDRSLDTVKRSNERLSNDLYQLRTELRVLQQQVDIIHGINP